MSPVTAGALAALSAVLGVLLLVSVYRGRRPGLVERVAPYVHQRQVTSTLLTAAPVAEGHTVSSRLLSLLLGGGHLLEAIGSSSASVRRRLARTGSSLGYDEFRLQQVLTAAAALGLTAAAGLALSLVHEVSFPALVLACLLAALGGAAARDWWLSRTVERRRSRIEAQLPDVVELLALAVGAGQGPVAAIERVVVLGQGDLVDELDTTLTDVRSGTVLSTALDRLERRIGSIHVTRLCEAIIVALERGTPLADVLRSQAKDARETARQDLMEEGGRREIAQMVPVVFLVLPITVVFALFPGLLVLRLGV